MSRKVISHRCVIIDHHIDLEGHLFLDILGGHDNHARAYRFPASVMAVEAAEVWAKNGTELDLIDRGDGEVGLRQSPAPDTATDPHDTPAARFFDGRRQGQWDAHGFNIDYPLTNPEDRP